MLFFHKYPLIKEIFHTIPMGILVLNSKKKIIFSNKYIQKHFHVSQECVLNHPVSDFLSSPMIPVDSDQMQANITSFKVSKAVYPLRVQAQKFRKNTVLYIQRAELKLLKSR